MALVVLSLNHLGDHTIRWYATGKEVDGVDRRPNSCQEENASSDETQNPRYC